MKQRETREQSGACHLSKPLARAGDDAAPFATLAAGAKSAHGGLPELLAPAGNAQALAAALAAGADAVYFGSEGFNARQNAGNFKLGDLGNVCNEVHMSGALAYLTLNTAILPGEMDDAVNVAWRAWEAGIDAVIVADIGLMSVLARKLPDMPLFASTQTHIKDSDTVRYLASIGVSRVTPARELSLDELRGMVGVANELGVGVEVFAHGAICFAYSGRCLMSSMIGGRSANRGLCAQPCRLPYGLIDESVGKAINTPGEHLLCTKDLCTIDALEELIDAGVASLKIEGRMKNAAYVSEAVGAYRAALDALDKPVDSAYAAEFPETAACLSRDTSPSLTRSAAELAPSKGEDARTVLAPERIKDGLSLETTSPAVTGNSANQFSEHNLYSPRGFTHCYLEGTHGNELMDYERGGFNAVGEKSSTGGNGDGETDDARDGVKREVDMHVIAHVGSPLKITATDVASGKRASATGAVVEAARTKAITREDVIEHVGRMGATPFVVRDWDVALDEGVGMGFSTLHKVRGEALDELKASLLAPWHERDACHGDGSRGTQNVCATRTVPMARKRTSSAIPACPSIMQNIPPNAVDDLGALYRKMQAHEPVEAGPALGVYNAEALELLDSNGVTRVWLGPELAYRDIEALAKQAPMPLGITVSGRQELMTSRHCVLQAQGPCDNKCATCKRRARPHSLKDRKGYRFPVLTDENGVSHIYNSVPLDLVEEIPHLLQLGISAFAVDTTLMDEKTAQDELARARKALKLAIAGSGTVAKHKGATTGHLFRGI
jgi:putative protease